ncbi:MAG: helix-turn-helix domain-containing protein [Campylobacterota bacterium]|nr:helix-turn-helix domain-containing protein [Campylobacterota bacterium]
MKKYSDISEEFIEEQYTLISRNIKKIRKEKKITQEELALAMGFTTATFYTNAENCTQGKHFNLEHLIKLSVLLNVNIQEFLL